MTACSGLAIIGGRGPCIILALALIAPLAAGQSGGDYELPRSVIGAGASSAGAEFSLLGVIAQPEADDSPGVGGSFSLQGGFLGGSTAQAQGLIFRDGFEAL